MSYRDLRNMSEYLRSVGYPRLVSLENFRNPNFQLVADIGVWLVKQYDPLTASGFPSETGTERDRVKFVTTFSEFMLSKIQVKLNMKRLYQADGYAVKELIKVVSILFTAMREADNFGGGNDERINQTSADFTTNIEDLRQTRMLASEITKRGATLYDMLQKEIRLREDRHTALSKAFELPEVERLLQGALTSAEAELRKANQLVENLESNFNTVTIKLEKKTQELERNEKRLVTLKKVRPAFMDEFEKLQGELETTYREYVCRYRVLAQMQHQIEEMNRQDAERRAEERLMKQELGMGSAEDLLQYNGGSRGGDGSGSEEESDVDDDSAHRNAKEFMAGRPKVKRPPGTAQNHLGLGVRSKLDRFEDDGIRSRVGKTRQVFGSMLGGPNDSGDSESDLLMMDGENADDNSDLGSEDGEEDDEDLAPMRPLQGRGLPDQLQEHMLRQELQNSGSLNLLNGNGELMLNGSSRTSDEGFRRLEQQSQTRAAAIANGGVKNRAVRHETYDDENGELDGEDEEDLLIKPMQVPVRAMSKTPRTDRTTRSIASTSSSQSSVMMGNGIGRDAKSRTKLVNGSSSEETGHHSQHRPQTRPRSNARHPPTQFDEDDDF